MNFPAILQRFMEKRGLNQYSLAKQGGIPQSSINRWMNGAYLPTLEKLNEMCLNLGITLADFFSEAGEAELIEASDPNTDGFIAAITRTNVNLSAQQAQAFAQAADDQAKRRQRLHQELDRLLDEYENKTHG